MALDSIQKRLDALGAECDKLASITEQMFDDLELMSQHIEIYHANRSTANSTLSNASPSNAGNEIDEFVADELMQIRKLIEAQGQLFCDWICRESRPGETSRSNSKGKSSHQLASA